MDINKNITLGAVHIKLPFNSMDDVSFSGAYGGVADELVDTLQRHLSSHNESTDNQSDEPDNEEGGDPDMDQLRKGLPYAK